MNILTKLFGPKRKTAEQNIADTKAAMDYMELSKAYNRAVYALRLAAPGSLSYDDWLEKAKELHDKLLQIDKNTPIHYKHSQLGNYPYPD